MGQVTFDDNGNSTVYGRVLDKDSGQPLAGVTVQAAGVQGDEAAITGSDGTYTLSALPVGNYSLNFFVPGSQR